MYTGTMSGVQNDLVQIRKTLSIKKKLKEICTDELDPI
jgi:hypothetical protein